MNESWQMVLQERAAELGIALETREMAGLTRCMEILQERSAVMNLTTITEPDAVAAKHFLDSLTVALVYAPAQGDAVFDVGSGAGFPGIPLALHFPQAEFVLNDATRKKTEYLREAISAAGTGNARAVWGRAEELAHTAEHRGKYAAVTARAVAHLAELIEICVPLLRVGGVLIAMKGPSGVAEIEEAAPALQALHAQVREVGEVSVAGAGERALIVVEKTGETPAQYPREMRLIRAKGLREVRKG